MKQKQHTAPSEQIKNIIMYDNAVRLDIREGWNFTHMCNTLT